MAVVVTHEQNWKQRFPEKECGSSVGYRSLRMSHSGMERANLYFFLTTDEVPWFQNLHPLSRVVPVDNGKCSQVGTAWGCEGKALPCSYGFTNAYSWKLLVRQMAWSQIEDPFGVLTFVSFKCLEENDPFKKRCHSFWKWQDHYVQYRRIYALLDRN